MRSMTSTGDQMCHRRFRDLQIAASGGRGRRDSCRLVHRKIQVSTRNVRSFVQAMASLSRDRRLYRLRWSFVPTAEDPNWTLASTMFLNAAEFRRVDHVEFDARCPTWGLRGKLFAPSPETQVLRKISPFSCPAVWLPWNKTRCLVPILQRFQRPTGSCRRPATGFVLLASTGRLFGNAR